MTALTVDEVSLLNGICHGFKKTSLGSKIADLQANPVIDCSLVITTDGAAVALVAANNIGVLNVVQSYPSATATLGGSVYVVSLDKVYSSFKSAIMVPTGQVPAVSNLHVVGNGVSGGVGTVVFTGAADADYITLTCPGVVGSVVLTAKTSAIADSQFDIGNGGTTGAANFATIINATGTGANCCAQLVAAGNPFFARVAGTCVVLTCAYAGATIKSHSVAHNRITTTALGVVDVASVMAPGLVIQTAVGVTAATPASGDNLRFGFKMAL